MGSPRLNRPRLRRSGHDRRWSSFVVSVVAVVAICLLVAASSGFAQTKARQFLFVGNGHIPPMIAVVSGKPQGLVVDLVQAMAARAGLDVKVVGADWAEAQRQVQDGEADALVQINPTIERNALFDFSSPLLASEFSIFRRAARADINGVDSLSGRTVGVEKGGYPAQILANHPQIKTRFISSWKAGFELVKADEIDAVLVDRWVGEYELSRNSIEGIAVVEAPVATSHSAIAVRKGNETLLAGINEGLAKIAADGTEARIRDKWRGREVVYVLREQLHFWAVIGALALGLLVFLVLFVFYAIRLRRLNASLSHQVVERKLAEQALQESITAQQAQEAALRLSQQRVQIAVKTAGIGIWEWDVQANMVVWDAEMFRIYGIPETDGGAAPYEMWRETLLPEEVEAQEAQLQRHAREGGGVGRREFRIRRSDGQIRVIQSVETIRYDVAGQTSWVIGTNFDVTDQKQAELDLKSLNATLEDRVRQAVDERQEAQARLAQSEKLAALGQLAGGVAHDFNNIAQAVTGGASMIGRHAEDPVKVRRLAGMLAETAARAASITRRMLSLARQGDLKAEAIEVEPLLFGLREFLAHTLGADIALKVEASPDLPAIMVDKGQLETVLVNLATNARDAIAGAGSITFAAMNEHLPCGRPEIGLAQGRYVQISVSDTGAGMDSATIARALEPFFTTKEPGKGTGLGLPMAQGFAEQSGGALKITSVVGRGTTVCISLPIAGAAKAPPQIQCWPSSPSGQGKTHPSCRRRGHHSRDPEGRTHRRRIRCCGCVERRAGACVDRSGRKRRPPGFGPVDAKHGRTDADPRCAGEMQKPACDTADRICRRRGNPGDRRSSKRVNLPAQEADLGFGTG